MRPVTEASVIAGVEIPSSLSEITAETPFVTAELENAEARRRQTIRRRDATYRRALILADLMAVGLALVAGTLLFGEDSLTPVGLVGALLIVIVVMKTLGLYDRDEQLLHKSTLGELPRLFEVATLSALLLWLAGDLLVEGDIGRRQVIGMWGILFLLFILGRSLARQIATSLTPRERCLLLGDERAAGLFGGKVALTGSVHAEIVGWLPVSLRTSDDGFPAILDIPNSLSAVISREQIHRIVLAPGRVHSDALVDAVRKLSTYVVNVSLMPATPQVSGSAAEIDDINGLTLLGVRSFEMSRSSRVLKRAFDLIASSLTLVVLSPLLAAIAVIIRIDSRGPVHYRQRRIGRDGEAFEIFKFRSMVPGAHAMREELSGLSDSEGLFKLDNDPRTTRVGRVLRRWSLDELPQLLNVLRGEMSLVGPRPLIPEEDSLIEGLYRRRLDLAPGITGYWQALGSSRIPLFEMVRLDYLYVATWSLWNDVQILLRTIPYVFGRRGR